MSSTSLSLTVPRPAYRFTSAAWKSAGIFALLFLAVNVVGPFVSPASEPGPPTAWGGDFLVAYSAGTLAREGAFETLHDPAGFMARIRAIGDAAGLPAGGGVVGPWLNPPFYLLPFLALSMMPYHTALLCWWALSLLAIAASSLILCRILHEPAPGRRLKLTDARPAADWQVWGLVPLLTLICMASMQTFTHGQSSAFSLLILTGAVYFWRAGRGFWAGLILGFLFFKPQLALLASAVLAVDLGRRAVLGLVLTGTFLTAVSGFCLTEPFALYLHHSPTAATAMQLQGVFPWHRHVTFTSLYRLLLQGPENAPPAWRVLFSAAISAVVLLGALVVGILRQRRPGLHPSRDMAATARRRDRLISAAIVVSPLVMPYYMDYDLLLLAVPALLFGRELLSKSTLTRSDVWTQRVWVMLYLAMYLSPGFTATFSVSINLPLLIALAGLLVSRMIWPDAKRETSASYAMGYSTRLRPAA